MTRLEEENIYNFLTSILDEKLKIVGDYMTYGETKKYTVFDKTIADFIYDNEISFWGSTNKKYVVSIGSEDALHKHIIFKYNVYGEDGILNMLIKAIRVCLLFDERTEKYQFTLKNKTYNVEN